MIEQALPGEVRVRRALISVSEKTGVVELAQGLRELDVEIVSTGGTARALGEAGIEVRAIEDYTGFPEMMDGRVKTLHPRLYAGLLALRDNDEHLRAAAEQEIEPVDLVCVNLYPFEQTLARGDASPAEIVENIDIGGPTMIRAAAKNSAYAAVLVDPGDYEAVLGELRASEGRLSLDARQRLAAKAFALTARYDAAISTWFSARVYGAPPAEGEGPSAEGGGPPAYAFPPSWRDAHEKVMDVRYGENPHQRAAYYRRVGARTHLLQGVEQLHGKELSFNNLLDLSSARELVQEFREQPACAIVKHNNPCGCAIAGTAGEAYEKAFACDPESAYGGVIAINRPIDSALAERLNEQFIEVLLAPGYEPAALEVLQSKKNVRLLELSRWPAPSHEVEAKPVIGGQLVQTRDVVAETREQMRTISARAPTEREWRDMVFAWTVCRHVRSNAIVLAAGDTGDTGDGMSGSATIGIGAGQMSRVDSSRIAVEKARRFLPEQLAGAAAASDAFFPFPDAAQTLLDAGVAAIVQPGGSVRDELTVAAVDAAGAAMVATGVRHFRH